MIGWARDDEAEQIQALLGQDGLFLKGGSWEGIGRTWLVYRSPGGSVIACIAVHNGIPLARLDFMSIDNGITGLSKARLVARILEAAFAVVALNGASFVSGMISYLEPDFGEFVAKRGGTILNEGQLYICPVEKALKDANGRRIKADDDHHGDTNTGGDRIHQAADRAC